MFVQARRTALSLLVVAFLPAAAQQSRGSADGLPPRDAWQKVPEILTALRALSQQEGFANIEVITGSESDPHLPANLDGAVILNSYHELGDYKSTLAAIKRALRPDGLLVLGDNAAGAGWFTERNDQASHHALDPKYVDAELRAAGFEIVNRRDDFILQPYAQWLIVARPSVR